MPGLLYVVRVLHSLAILVPVLVEHIASAACTDKRSHFQLGSLVRYILHSLAILVPVLVEHIASAACTDNRSHYQLVYTIRLAVQIQLAFLSASAYTHHSWLLLLRPVGKPAAGICRTKA